MGTSEHALAGQCDLRTAIKLATTDNAAPCEVQQKAETIRREKVVQTHYILQHLRQGGWGRKDVAAPTQLMPYPQEEAGKGLRPGNDCSSRHALQEAVRRSERGRFLTVVRASFAIPGKGDPSSSREDVMEHIEWVLDRTRLPLAWRRVVYLLDWFAPHLDSRVDDLVHIGVRALFRNLTPPVETCNI